jgi:hypothetical protein
VLRDGARFEGFVERTGDYEAEMRAYSLPAIRESSRMMSMATAEFPFKIAASRPSGLALDLELQCRTELTCECRPNRAIQMEAN